MNSFLLITTFRNAERFIAESVSRSLRQRYGNYRCVFIDDASTDDSDCILRDTIQRCANTHCREVHVETHATRCGPMHHQHAAILKYGAAEDVIVTVDGDDWLLHDDVLTVVNAFYERQQCWLAYGGAVWKPIDRQTYESAAYTKHEIAELRTPWYEGPNAAQAKWKVHHLRTFRNELYRALGILDPQWNCLKDSEGRLYESAGDVAMMLPLLELAGADRIGHMRAKLYVYNLHRDNEHVLARPQQLRNLREIFAKPSFPRLGALEPTLTAQSFSPMFVRPPRASVGAELHVSGWPYARQQLQNVRCSHAILLDDFVEQSFCYGDVPPQFDRPWIGIFHHPPNIPDFSFPAHQLQLIFHTTAWQRNCELLLGAITLSEHLASHLRRMLQIPVVAVKHPSASPAQCWNEHAYLSSKPATLLQTGYYLRNTRAIHQLPPISGYQKARLLPQQPWVTAYDARVRDFWQRTSQRAEYGDVFECGFVSADEYERRLTESVILTEVFDASANNVLIECIQRNTPLIVNRHPAVVEYLGAAYPLYFDDLTEIPALLVTRRVIDAHHYLSQIDKQQLSGEQFTKNIEGAIKTIMSNDG